MSTSSPAARVAYDVARLRADFPILGREVRGQPLVYLDSAATSQKPRSVIEAITHYYENSNANVHRGIHALAEEATDLFEGARARVARFLGAPAPECVIFTRGTTESINLVASSWGRANLRAGDEIVVTELEHHSNLVPWQLIAQATGARLVYLPITDEGILDLEAAQRLIGARVRLVAVGHKSNALGTINPIAQIVAMAHAVGAVVLVDGAQSTPHLAVDFTALGADFFACSGHKALGPTGIGVLVAKRELLDAMPPYHGGGEMIARVDRDRSTYAELPHKFEAGTPNIAGAIGLAAGFDYLERVGLAAIHAHEVELTRYALARLGDLDFIRVFGPRDPARRAGVVTFEDRDVHPHDLGTLLDAEGVAVRAGHHCAQVLMRRLGVVATTRASFYLYTTMQEIDRLADALVKAHEYFHGR